MADPTVNPEAASTLFRILREHLASDPQGREAFAQFELDPQNGAQALTDYLQHRRKSDSAFFETLTATPGLPADLRTVIQGGHVERIIQIAQAGTVIVAPTPTRYSKRFWVTIASIVGVIVVGAVLFIVIPKPLPPMPDGFNVAVATFGEQAADGTIKVTEDSAKLSDWLFSAITQANAQLPTSIKVNLPRGPNQTGLVTGKDREARTQKAKKIAEQHNATILIYGVITVYGDSHQVEPEFYVSDTSFGYGSEVAGPDHLGQPITYQGALFNELGKVNEKLDARTTALQYIVKGLAQFYVGKYTLALSEFQQAKDTPGWLSDDGQEVIYLLIGATQLRLYDPKMDSEVRAKALADASESFAYAYNLNPDYARSYLGLGSIALQQAKFDSNVAGGTLVGTDSWCLNTIAGSPVIDEEKLIEAYGWYSKSLSSIGQPALAYVPIKAAFGLGQIHLVGYECHLPGWSAQQARVFLDQVVMAYDRQRSPDLAWFAGHAHYYIGRLAGLDRNWPGMSAECRTAIGILGAIQVNPPRNWIARYWIWVGYAEEQSGRIDEARNAYRRAIDTGQGIVGSEEIAKWQAALDHVAK